jgi:RND superfamily putative drug exporter
VPINTAITTESGSDLELAEAISLPITLILLLLIFGSVVAAALPVLVGGLAIVGSLGVLRLISLAVDVNSFAVNVVSLLGLGLAIDYGLRTGLLRTGRMISSAALLLIVVTGAFGLSQLQTMRFLGVGMIVALVLDATVVRMLLVPAVLRLLGNAAWWAPAGLHRLRGQVKRRSGPAQLGGAVADDHLLHAERDGEVEEQRAGAQALR